jgi:CubicO group peptidase (beta-lactamase class C family)
MLLPGAAELADRALREFGVPGVAVALTDRERTLELAVAGLADREAGRPVVPETLFPIGSVSKTMCALAILREHESGRLELDAPVTDYLPWFEVASEHDPVTVRHLLTHSAGITSGNEGSPSPLLDALALARTKATEPGVRFHYSNAGYTVLGLVLERVTGRWVGDVLTDGVLEPAGMSASTPAMSVELRSRLATGYAPADWRPPHRPGEPLAPAPFVESDSAAGSVCSTAEDMASFARLVLARGRPIVSEESFAVMTTPLRGFADDGWGYGCGISVHELEGRRIVGHSGSTPGHTACVRVDLDAGLGVVVLCNADPVATFPPGTLVDGAFGLAVESGPDPGWEPLDTNVPTELEPYVGTYASYSPWYPGIVVAVRGGRLIALYPGADLPLVALPDGDYRLGDDEGSPERIRFGALVDGRAAWLEDGGWLYGRLADAMA